MTRPGPRSRWLIAGGVLLLLFAGLIVLAFARSGPRQGSVAGAPAPSSANRVVPIALTSVDGKPLRLPAGRPGGLLFATASCSSCAASARALGQAKKSIGSNVDAAFISIDPSEPPSAVRALQSFVGGPPYPFAVDSTGNLYRAYHVNALGTAVVYDAHGRQVARMIEPDLGQWEAALRKAGAA